ncbi:MAG: ATP-binding protein, partial [Paracoccaceae bacterium]
IVTARPLALRRAATNLIENALKYGRRAHVTLEANATQAHLTIADQGGRIDPELIAKLTTPFSRGENSKANPLQFNVNHLLETPRQPPVQSFFDRLE